MFGEQHSTVIATLSPKLWNCHQSSTQPQVRWPLSVFLMLLLILLEPLDALFAGLHLFFLDNNFLKCWVECYSPGTQVLINSLKKKKAHTILLLTKNRYLKRGESSWEAMVGSEWVKLIQLCPTLCDPMECSPWNAPGHNTGVGSHSLLQGIFPTEGSNRDLPHCRKILYQLSHQGSRKLW